VTKEAIQEAAVAKRKKPSTSTTADLTTQSVALAERVGV
jgi:hypothetical protein